MKRQKIMKKIFIIITGLGALIIFSLFGIYFYFESEVQKPLKIIGEEKVFEVEEGERTRDIGRRLEKEGLIKDDLYFLFYAFKEGKGRNIVSGRYCLSSDQTIEEIVDVLTKSPIAEAIKLTFPEGWRLSKIEERLKERGLVENKEILNFKIKDFKGNYSFLADAPDEASFEGFLFPDTYFFGCESPKIICQDGKAKIEKCQKGNIKEIINKFLLNFDEKLNEELRKEIKTQGKTIYEIVIMASIIEKEVATFEDRQIVSGIFWKRIKEGLKLDSCATIAYVLGQEGWSFDEMRKEIREAKEIDSPYNSYKYPGLPPGPISNPGLDSIKAAIDPKETDDFYFLTDPKSGKTIFSRTLEEQRQNELKYFGK